MIRYKCRVSDSTGKISESLYNAPSQQALIKQINDESLYLISFRIDQGKKKKRFSRKVILDFTDTMALMLEAGITIRDALKVSSATFKDNKTGELIAALSDSLNKGRSFPEAIEELHSDFPPLYRGMVKIGDNTGSMDEVFGKLSKYLNDEKIMREKIQGALMYPILVLSVLFLGLTGVFFYVFPKIRKTFAIDTLDVVFQRFQVLMFSVFIPLVLIILFILFIVLFSRNSGKFKTFADGVLLKSPLIGRINLLRSSLNIMFSLEVLTSSGYPLETALNESSSVLSNKLLKEALLRIRKAIISGEKLSSAFERETLFPLRMSLWIAIGEASGNVGRVFSQLRVYFQGELDKMTSRIMLLVEPVLIVLVGVFMILFVVLFVVPLFGIFGAIL